MFVVGSTFGEAIIPVCIGAIMHFTGPQALMYCTLTIAIIMTGIYLVAHHLLVGSGKRLSTLRGLDVNQEEQINVMHTHEGNVEMAETTCNTTRTHAQHSAHPGLVDGKSLYLA
jgi:hypothetical protein